MNRVHKTICNKIYNISFNEFANSKIVLNTVNEIILVKEKQTNIIVNVIYSLELYPLLNQLFNE